MDAMNLDPLSARVRFLSVLPQTGDEWSRILGTFLQGIAARCEDTGQDTIVGHVKALALFAGNAYIRASVVGGFLPPECEVSAALDSAEMTASVNVLVYGLDSSKLEQIVRDEAEALQDQSVMEVTIEKTSAAHHCTHDENGQGHA